MSKLAQPPVQEKKPVIKIERVPRDMSTTAWVLLCVFSLIVGPIIGSKALNTGEGTQTLIKFGAFAILFMLLGATIANHHNFIKMLTICIILFGSYLVGIWFPTSGPWITDKGGQLIEQAPTLLERIRSLKFW